MQLLKKTAVTTFLSLWCHLLFSQSQPYIEVGAGLAVLHESHVLMAQNQRFPIQGYAEYGWVSKRYSLSAVYDFNSTYRLDNYEMNPSFAGLFVNRLMRQWKMKKYDVQLFFSAGMLYEMHRFLDRGNAFVPGYVLEEERKNGIGAAGRLLVKVIFGKIAVVPSFQFFRSNQEFIAGRFSEQSFQTGSTRVMFSIGYKFNRNGNSQKICPTYY